MADCWPRKPARRKIAFLLPVKGIVAAKRPEAPENSFELIARCLMLSSSVRVPARLLVLLALSALLSGCFINERGIQSPYVTAREGLTPIQEDPVVLVATTRKPVGRSPWFGADRGANLTFAEARLAPPTGLSRAL